MDRLVFFTELCYVNYCSNTEEPLERSMLNLRVHFEPDEQRMTLLRESDEENCNSNVKHNIYH